MGQGVDSNLTDAEGGGQVSGCIDSTQNVSEKMTSCHREHFQIIFPFSYVLLPAPPQPHFLQTYPHPSTPKSPGS